MDGRIDGCQQMTDPKCLIVTFKGDKTCKVIL